MAKAKGRLTENQYSRDEYDNLVKKAELATASLYSLRYKARNLREDIGEADDAIADLEEDIRNYVENIGNRVNEKREKIQLFFETAKKKIYEMETATKKRLKEIEEEKEEIEKQRTQAQEQAQLLRVKLAELERNILLEASQREKIVELEDVLVQIKIEHDKALKDLKTEFTSHILANVQENAIFRDLRKMRRDYEEKMDLTNNYAKKLLKPCVTEIVNNMKDANTSLAHYMRRISQKQGVLFKKMPEIEGETNHLRYEYELWKDIQTRKFFRRDPQLPTNNYSLEQNVSNYVGSSAQVDIVSSVDKIMKVTPYEELTNTLRSLLGPKDSPTESDISAGSESQKEDSSDERENTETMINLH